MTGTADPNIAIGYIPRALNEITAYLREAATTRATEKERALYRRAARASCRALRRLASHDQLWNRLEDDHRRRMASWNDLEVPTLAKLLDGLGYSGATPATKVIADANQQLRQAAGIWFDGDPVSAARTAVGELRDEVCGGLEAADLARGRDRFRAVRNTFVATFMAVVVLPELQDYLRSLNLDQEVVEMARELAQRAGDALSSISLGLIAIPKAVSSMPGSMPRTTAAEAVQQPGRQPDPAIAMPVTKSSHRPGDRPRGPAG